MGRESSSLSSILLPITKNPYIQNIGVNLSRRSCTRGPSIDHELDSRTSCPSGDFEPITSMEQCVEVFAAADEHCNAARVALSTDPRFILRVSFFASTIYRPHEM